MHLYSERFWKPIDDPFGDGSKAPFGSRLARGQYDAGAGLCFLILLLPIFWSYEKDQRPGRLFGKRLGNDLEAVG